METVASNNVINLVDLRDIYKVFHPTTAGYIAHMGHFLGQATNKLLANLKRLKTKASIFFKYNGVKLEINNRRNTGKFRNTCKLKNKHTSKQPINHRKKLKGK